MEKEKPKSKKGVPLKCRGCHHFKSECTCGRKTKRTKETAEKLVDCLKKGFTIRQACICAGIDSATFYNWCKEDPAFLSEIEQAKQYVNIAAKKLIQTSIAVDKSVDTAKWYLERRESALYSTKQVHEVAETTTEKLEDDEIDELDKLIDANI